MAPPPVAVPPVVSVPLGAVVTGAGAVVTAGVVPPVVVPVPPAVLLELLLSLPQDAAMKARPTANAA